MIIIIEEGNRAEKINSSDYKEFYNFLITIINTIYRLENLRFICLNYDSQLPTFGGRN